MLTQLHTTNHSQNVFAPSLYYKLPSLDLQLIICPSLRTNYTSSVGSSPLMSSACLLMVKGHQVLCDAWLDGPVSLSLGLPRSWRRWGPRLNCSQWSGWNVFAHRNVNTISVRAIWANGKVWANSIRTVRQWVEQMRGFLHRACMEMWTPTYVMLISSLQ